MYAPANQYRQMQVTTASPEKVLLMLYDGAINFTKMAKERIGRNDIAGKGVYISKALAIVTELMNTLNHEICANVTRELERLYLYVIGEFTKANLNNDPAALDNAVKILSSLRETWTEAIAIVQRERVEARGEQRLVAG